MSIRLIIQPVVAIVFGIVAGKRDVRDGRPPFLFLSALFVDSSHRSELLRQAWKDVGKVFIVAVILDSIYQVIVHAAIYTLELLITATILAIVPYALVRGLVTYVARRRMGPRPAGGEVGNTSSPVQDQQPERKED